MTTYARVTRRINGLVHVAIFADVTEIRMLSYGSGPTFEAAVADAERAMA